jgi:hemerythrin superfamily protein
MKPEKIKDKLTMKSTDVLKQQHREIEELFRQLRAKDADDDRETLRHELADMLTAHTEIEEELFYPAAMDLLGIQCRALEATEEHVAANFVLSRCMSVKVTDVMFSARLETLYDIVMNHIEEEESELFGQYESEADRTATNELGERMAHRFGELIKEGHVAILAEQFGLPTIGVKKAKKIRRGQFKPLTLGSLPRVFVNILAMDDAHIIAFGSTIANVPEMSTWFTTTSAKLTTVGNVRGDLATFFRSVLVLTKVSRSFFVKDFDRLLDDLGKRDFWGTEGQCDPRGCRRELRDSSGY